jgi:hypothetical protein
MSSFTRAALAAALLLVAFTGPAHGFGYWVRGTAAYYPSYYPAWSAVSYYPAYSYSSYYTPIYAQPVAVSYYAPVWPGYPAEEAVVCPPVVSVAAPAWAIPTAAPPSQTPEPPVRRSGGPTVTESLNGAVGPKSVEVGAGSAGTCRVGFWNLTGRDITLTVDGQARLLPRDRGLTLTLGRQFVWQVDQRTPQSEDIPDGHCTLEIVLRK